MIKWGIIGAGNIAKRFAKSLAYEEDAVLYAISGRNMAKLTSFQQEHPCEKIYIGHENLLNDPEVDAVYIALPHDMHKELALQAMSAGKAVLCEKPAVLNAEEMKEIAELSRHEKILFMEAMKSRFEPAYLKTKELIKEGKIGTVISIKAQIGNPFPLEKMKDSYIGRPGVGGCLLDTGCYCVNWLNDYFKEEPVIKKEYANVQNGIDFYVDAKLQFDEAEGEVIAAIDRKLEPLAEIIGTKGRIVVDHPHRPTAVHVFLNGEEEKGYEMPYIHDDFYGQIHHFNALFKEGKTESDVMTLDDSIRNAHLMDLIRSAYTDYDPSDLAVLEQQEKALRYDTFTNEDALILGEEIIELQKEYDRGIAVRIVREPDGLVLFQYVMRDKGEKNFMYAEGKHHAITEYGHSSAWVNIAARLPGFVLKEGVLPSGGAFPIFLKDGTLAASVLVSGIHEGKDHELVVRALSDVLDCSYPEFKKALG